MAPMSKSVSLASAVFLFMLILGMVVPVLAQNCSKDNPCATGCCSKNGWCGTGEDHCGDGNCVDTCNFKLQCDANTPCETGCCSNAGYCGLGPDYCGPEVCVSGCDAKAECDPGFGLDWAEKSKCPLNVCCSDFGFCGTTKEFCGNKTVSHSTCDKKTATLDRVVGYYEAWSARRSCNAFWPEQIPMGVYTHINFAFAAIDPVTFEVRPDQTQDLALLKRVTDLKTLDPDLKVLIALGGWTFNDPGPTQTTFSDIARSKENQQKFFKSLLNFLSTYNLDGVDLDWEYPEAGDRNGRPEDFVNFPTFMANLKSALDGSGGRNELSITLPASYWYLQHFDIVKLEPHVSFFNIMSYDLHGKWDLGNQWTGEYLNAHTNLTEIDKAMELLWRNKIDSSKVVMGLAFYARAYTLVDPGCVKPGCLFASGANEGNCSREVGILLNSEIDTIVKDKDLTPTFYEDAAVEVLHWDDQWLSYDDSKTLKLKVDYAHEQCLGGVMVWAISHDTKNAKYSKALGSVSERTQKTLPGIFQEEYADIEPEDPYMTKVENHAQCKWSNCGDYCPAGWSMMTRDDDWNTTANEIMLDDFACTSPHARRLCCPSGEKAPKCGFYSFLGGKCDGKCPSGYREVGSLERGCRSGYQAACCTMEDDTKKLLNATRLYDNCDWATTPDCNSGKCTFAGSAWPTEFVTSTSGGGAAYCHLDHDKTHWSDDISFWKYVFQRRKYCCDTSDKNSTWGTCTWRDDVETYGTTGKKCMSGCKSNEIKVALEGGEECIGPGGGAKAYCCTGTYKTSQEVLVPALAEYENDLAAWVKDPVCGASGGLSKRQQSVLKDTHWLGVLHIAQKLIRGGATGSDTKTMTYTKDMWDKYLTDKWENLSSDNIIAWTNDEDRNPDAHEYSPEQWASEIMCSLDEYNEILADDYMDPGRVCVLACPVANNKRTVRSKGDLVPRNIRQSAAVLSSTETVEGQPNWGFIVERIIDGSMPFFYEMLIHTNNGESILEMVWELPGEEYREYQDDRWAVFHFHFEHLADRDGVMRPGIYAINAFHAQRFASTHVRSRVNGNEQETLNTRAEILTCRTGDESNVQTQFWYPGDIPNASMPDDFPTWAQRLTRFGNYLWDEDMITAEAFTAANRGQLTTSEYETGNPACPLREEFGWNGYDRSQPFTPDGQIQTRPNN